jgi:hypothetical protein
MKTWIAAALTLVAGVAFASEKKIKESQVPRPVLETVQQKYPGMKAVGFEQEVEEGKTQYEVKLKKGSDVLELALTPDGKLLTEEKKIAVSAVPENVKKGLDGSKYAKWKIQSAEQVTETGKEKEPNVELVLSQGKQRHEVLFAFDGSITKDEDQSAQK